MSTAQTLKTLLTGETLALAPGAVDAYALAQFLGRREKYALGADTARGSPP